ncbi:MAG: hypothetical protein AB7F94_17490 [Nitrospira sp.]
MLKSDKDAPRRYRAGLLVALLRLLRHERGSFNIFLLYFAMPDIECATE